MIVMVSLHKRHVHDRSEVSAHAVQDVSPFCLKSDWLSQSVSSTVISILYTCCRATHWQALQLDHHSVAQRVLHFSAFHVGGLLSRYAKHIKIRGDNPVDNKGWNTGIVEKGEEIGMGYE